MPNLLRATACQGLLSNLALIVWDQGQLAEADSLLRQASDGWRRIYGMEHPSTLMALANLAAG